MLIYIAGPYRGKVKENIAHARKVAIQLWEMGHTVICPHLNTANFDKDCNVSEEIIIQRDLNILIRCDALMMLIGWEESEGAVIEWAHAKEADIYIYYEDGRFPELHPTEVKCPKQVMAFKKFTTKMYLLHLEKNADYSPANILGTGTIGIVTRLWDKIARLMNLAGFDITVTKSEFNKPKQPKCESIRDTILDAANYAAIAELYDQNKWGV